MDNIRKLLPKDKEDVDFINELNCKNIDEIREIIPELLIWMQDGNWPQAKLIANYLSPHINEIENEIVSILNGNDPIWKYWTLSSLIYYSNTRPNDGIITAIYNLYNNANELEREEEVDLVAKHIIDKKW